MASCQLIKVDLPPDISPEARSIYEEISRKDLEREDKGWSVFVQDLEVRLIKGSHESMMKGDNLKKIAGIIQGDV